MIFFTDLDGTLLTDTKDITPKTKEAVHRALDEGHKVVLTTGRAVRSALFQAQRLGLTRDGCYLICYNGARLYDIGAGQVIYKASLPEGVVQQVFELGAAEGVHVQAYADDDAVIAVEENEKLVTYCTIQKLVWQVLGKDGVQMPPTPPKMLAIEYEADKMKSFREKVVDTFTGKVDIFQSQPTYLEIVPLNTNKGNAVRWLCDYLHTPIEETVAAGDAENDLTLIQAAHLGAVMINGTPGVKKYASYITEHDNNHDGVAEIIEKFILKI